MITVFKTMAWMALGILAISAATLSAASQKESMDSQTIEVMAKIKGVEASLRTFEAKYRQIQKSRLFEQIVESQGEIYYSAEGKIRFTVLNPQPLTIIMDGEWIIVEDPQSGRSQKHRAPSRENVLKKYFGVGQSIEELNRRFAVKASANDPLPGYTLTMVPKQSTLAAKVKQITAQVDDATWLPRQVVIQQSETEWMRMDLEFTKINQKLPEGIFARSEGTESSTSPEKLNSE